MAATATQIKTGSQHSACDMARQLGWVKVFEPTVLNHAGVVCKIYQDPSDPNLAAKLTGLKSAISRVTGKRFSFTNGISFYCTDMAGVASIAFSRNFTGTRQACVLLGKSCVDAGNPGMFKGVAHEVAPHGGANYCAAVVVHELGHNLHERANEGFFWDGAAASVPDAQSNQVSAYAGKNALEFVAETFTGLMYGETYNNAVMSAYAGYLGPTSSNFP